VRTIKAWWLVLAFLSGFALAVWSEEIILNWRDNRLEISAPRVHFLGGKPLEMLHNAADVPFDFQVTLWSGTHNHVAAHLYDRFVVSYDLWGERFRVVKTQSPVSRADHLTAPEAEKWCVAQMGLDVSGIAGNELLWLRMEIRAEDGKEGPLFPKGSVSESGISLASLIELFSHTARSESHWGPFEMGPFTLDELKHAPRRGS
jgi:hypothetical protein